MQNLWLKIKVWTKISLFTIVALYLIIFIYNNADQPVTIWYMFGKDEIRTTALKVIPLTFLAGIIGTLIFRMAFRSVRQIRELRSRNAAAKMSQDVEDLKTKAAMLQTKPPIENDAAKPM
jgi:uncharacterized integral membrane protein